jgi:hypothetical protein
MSDPEKLVTDIPVDEVLEKNKQEAADSIAEQKSRRAKFMAKMAADQERRDGVPVDLKSKPKVEAAAKFEAEQNRQAFIDKMAAGQRLRLVNKAIEIADKTEQAKEQSKEEAKEEPKAEEEEALKSEPPETESDLNPDERKKVQIIRWKMLKAINDKYAVIKSYGGKCAIMTEAQSPLDPEKKVWVFQRKDAFQQWMANKFLPSLKKRNESRAVGPWWFEHKKRREYHGVVFQPLKPPELRTSTGISLFNMYLGWGVQPKQGDWSLMRQHIKEVLADGDPKTDDYIIRWCAWAVQHPDKLPLVALVLIGLEGRGKGTFARALERIFGEHAIQISSQKHLVGNFNKHFDDLILLIADEAYWAGHKSDAGTLQRMITEPTLTIEPKGFDIRVVKNYIHPLMLAEPGWAVPAGPDERRYAVYAVCDILRDEPYFNALYREIEGDGPAAMLYDLQRMPLGDWHPRRIYKTAALRYQQELSLSPLEEWLLTLLDDGCLPNPPLGKLWMSKPTTLLNDAKDKIPKLRDPRSRETFQHACYVLREMGL